MSGCGGTWTDDAGNFERVFGFKKPKDVKVLHSYYWKSPHWSTEYRYFIELEAPEKFVAGLTALDLMTPIVQDKAAIEGCDGKRPPWFLPKPLSNYEIWTPKTNDGYRVFRDKAQGTLFLCDQRL